MNNLIKSSTNDFFQTFRWRIYYISEPIIEENAMEFYTQMVVE